MTPEQGTASPQETRRWVQYLEGFFARFFGTKGLGPMDWGESEFLPLALHMLENSIVIFSA